MGGKVSSKMAAVGRVVQVRLSNFDIYRSATTLVTQVSTFKSSIVNASYDFQGQKSTFCFRFVFAVHPQTNELATHTNALVGLHAIPKLEHVANYHVDERTSLLTQFKLTNVMLTAIQSHTVSR